MSASNNRASLLSGLRTGGVRSASGSIMPHTAALGGSFQVPRFPPSHPPMPTFDDGGDELGQTLQYGHMNSYGVPMTASHIDGRAPRFQQAQQSSLQQQQMLRQAQIAALSGMQGMNPVDQTHAQLLQLQLMQAMVAQQQQTQKLQAEIVLQQQVALALAAQQTPRMPNGNSRIPMTAAPTQTSFDIRSNAMAQLRNSRMALAEEKEDTVPMTAALGGKFGSRSLPTGLNPHAASFKMGDDSQPPPTPSSTVVISGGVSLGNPSAPTVTTSSKSDSAVSWRRGSAPALSNINRSGSPPKVVRRQSPPAVTVSSPEQVEKETSPVQVAPAPRMRPQPLRINGGNSPLVPAVTIENEEGQTVYASNQNTVPNPPSPASSQSSHDGPKKYEGLGIGRPVVANQALSTAVRVSQPLRQPRGPPAGAEDLGLKNFAARVKRNTSAPMVIAQEAVIIEAY